MSGTLNRTLYAVVNAAGLPGVGTLLSGRKRLGWVQIGLSLVFMALSALPLVAMAMEMAARGMTVKRLVDLFLFQDTWIFSNRESTLFFFALAGLLGYMTNLLWSLTTTRPKRQSSPPPLPHPPRPPS
ncbi:MAG: hypothetical protein SFU85_13575 [Candidatus Methylacidiphilales bacterium]|nr:hypothetical protein [Candidatus Methylacidiphilales bacterium]